MTKKELVAEATENQILAQARDLAVKIRDSANQIWLAGLGAFSKAQQEGVEMFEALVAEGEKVQERTKAAADERLSGMREMTTETWHKVEKVFDDRVGRALRTLSVPSRHDIDTLLKRVHVITKKLGSPSRGGSPPWRHL